LRRAATALLTLMGIAACPQQEKAAVHDYDCLGAGCARRTVDALVPAGAPIHVEVAKTFRFEGRDVRITWVRYGYEADFGHSSSLCAIEDVDVLLLFAHWCSPGEQPSSVAMACPSFAADTSHFDTRCDQCPTPGLRHPLLASNAFLVPFAQNECSRGGNFDNCLECLCAKQADGGTSESGAADAKVDM